MLAVILANLILAVILAWKTSSGSNKACTSNRPTTPPATKISSSATT